ncbi:MAG: DNA repair protein RecN [Terriglobales bacterium]
MLITLQIEDYALLERASIDFGPGLNVLSGETGSGKSILVDALGLLLGERAEAAAVRSGAKQAVVTGRFCLPFASAVETRSWIEEHGLDELEEEVRLRREVGGARSRAFIDHQPVTLALLRQMAQRLGEIHSQNEALVSFTPTAQLRLLDRFAGLEAEAAGLAAAYTAWRKCSQRARADEDDQRRRREQTELWRFQANEIDAVQPREGEDDRLSAERQILANCERVLAAAHGTYSALYDAPDAAAAQLKAAQRALQDWQRFDGAVEGLHERVEAVRTEVNDIALEALRLTQRIEASPTRLAAVEERLVALERLQRKYGPTLAAVLEHRRKLAIEMELLTQSETTTAAARAETEAAEETYRKLASGASRKRRAAARRLKAEIEAEVAELAMKLDFAVDFADAEAGASGCDRVRFLASTNPGEPPQPVAEIASGGELSRLLLALHLVTETSAGDPLGRQRTLVLDEIDAGIGGQAAAAVGRKLQRLGEHFQVLCVTHLAQIACCARHHLRVEKRESQGRTVTEVRPLDGAAREAEIARMLAGNAEDPTALRHARELLATGGGQRRRARD